LPPETLDRIARLLPAQDRLALSLTSQTVSGAAAGAIEGARVTARAWRVKSLATFLDVLGPATARVGDGSRTVRSVRRNLQAEPLLALGCRICGLPMSDAAKAARTFVAAVVGLDAGILTAALTDLASAASESLTEGSFEKLSSQVYAVAAAHVRAGECVTDVARRFGFTVPDVIADLERVAIAGPAGIAVRTGEAVNAVAKRFGIETPQGVADLEREAIDGPAGVAVGGGESVVVVARRHGIERKSSVEVLETVAIDGPAGAAVRAREFVPAVAERHGIATTLGLVRLELIAIDSHAGPAVLRGESVLDVAKEFGITTQRNRTVLERIAIAGLAGEAARKGEQEVAQRYGITTIGSKAILANFAQPPKK
jgi:hypothetical protein